MSSKNGIFSKSVITTRQLSSKDSGNLIDAGFPFPKATLQPFLADRFYKLAKLMPREIGLVAYHNKEKGIF